MKQIHEQNSDETRNPKETTKCYDEERMEKMFVAVSICREGLEFGGYDTSGVDDGKMKEFIDEVAEELDPYINDSVRIACDRVGIPRYQEEPKA